VGVAWLGLHGAALIGDAASGPLTADAWRTAYGSPTDTALRVALIGLLLVAIVMVDDPALRWFGPLGALAVALSFALSGHVAVAEPTWLSGPAVALHALLASFWLGSLAPLWLILRRLPVGQAREPVVTFSRIAMVAVPALIGAGATLAVLQVAAPAALIGMAYGRWLLLKLGLVALMLALAVCNRYRLRVRLAAGEARAAAQLRRTIGIEGAVALLVLAVTAALGAVTPPRALDHHDHAADPGGRSVAAQAGGMTLVVTVHPGRPGANSLDLVLVDSAGQAAEALELGLRLTPPAPDVEPLAATALPSSPGRFSVDAVDLPLAGRWQIRADVLVDDFTQQSLVLHVDIGG
jgi:copper transport protein